MMYNGKVFEVDTCFQKLALASPLGPACLQPHCVCSTEKWSLLALDTRKWKHHFKALYIIIVQTCQVTDVKLSLFVIHVLCFVTLAVEKDYQSGIFSL